MRVNRNLSYRCPAATLSVLVIVSFAAAQRGGPLPVRIKNFGRVNETLYRGAQPNEQDYAELAALGIKMVIDLQRDGERNEERLVEAAGMKFHRISMSDSEQPSREHVDEFLRLVNDSANQPVFVHCRGGRHRTGAMIGIYRMTTQGWTPDQAYEEMKQYQFNKGFGHGALKDSVYEYYRTMEHKGVLSSAAR